MMRVVRERKRLVRQISRVKKNVDLGAARKGRPSLFDSISFNMHAVKLQEASQAHNGVSELDSFTLVKSQG
jgi:hypothetical protein